MKAINKDELKEQLEESKGMIERLTGELSESRRMLTHSKASQAEMIKAYRQKISILESSGKNETT